MHGWWKVTNEIHDEVHDFFFRAGGMIGPEGVKQLSDILEQNTTLTSLTFCGNSEQVFFLLLLLLWLLLYSCEQNRQCLERRRDRCIV